jgi:hypothetical protein
MNRQEFLDERTLEVLRVIAGNKHVTEKFIRGTLRKEGTPLRNRHDLYRCLKKLQQYGLITYENDYGVYMLCRKAVYDRRELEKKEYARFLELWNKIKDAHEFQRAFGVPP